jgi:hypothetical protein
MSAFVENARGEISKLWGELLVSEEEQGDFTPYFDGEHSESSSYQKAFYNSASQMNTRKNY